MRRFMRRIFCISAKITKSDIDEKGNTMLLSHIVTKGMILHRRVLPERF